MEQQCLFAFRAASSHAKKSKVLDHKLRPDPFSRWASRCGRTSRYEVRTKAAHTRKGITVSYQQLNMLIYEKKHLFCPSKEGLNETRTCAVQACLSSVFMQVFGMGSKEPPDTDQLVKQQYV